MKAAEIAEALDTLRKEHNPKLFRELIMHFAEYEDGVVQDILEGYKESSEPQIFELFEHFDSGPAKSHGFEIGFSDADAWLKRISDRDSYTVILSKLTGYDGYSFYSGDPAYKEAAEKHLLSKIKKLHKKLKKYEKDLETIRNFGN